MMPPLQVVIDKETEHDRDIRFCPCTVCDEAHFCKVECRPFKDYVSFSDSGARKVLLIKKYNSVKLKQIAMGLTNESPPIEDTTDLSKCKRV